MKLSSAARTSNKHVSKRGKGGKHAPSTKTPIIGAVQRKGNVVARVLQFVSKEDMQNFVRETVSDKVSLLATDEHRGYAGLRRISAQDRHAQRASVRYRCGPHEHD